MLMVEDPFSLFVDVKPDQTTYVMQTADKEDYVMQLLLQTGCFVTGNWSLDLDNKAKEERPHNTSDDGDEITLFITF